MVWWLIITLHSHASNPRSNLSGMFFFFSSKFSCCNTSIIKKYGATCIHRCLCMHLHPWIHLCLCMRLHPCMHLRLRVHLRPCIHLCVSTDVIENNWSGSLPYQLIWCRGWWCNPQKSVGHCCGRGPKQMNCYAQYLQSLHPHHVCDQYLQSLHPHHVCDRYLQSLRPHHVCDRYLQSLHPHHVCYQYFDCLVHCCICLQKKWFCSVCVFFFYLKLSQKLPALILKMTPWLIFFDVSLGLRAGKKVWFCVKVAHLCIGHAVLLFCPDESC